MASSRTIVASVADAVQCIENGMTVGIGGALNVGHPMALVRALLKRDVSDLTIVAGFGGFDIDMLAGSGIARRIIAAFVGAEGVAGLPPLLGWAVQTGRVEIWDIDEGLLLTALRAAAQRLPFATWRCGIGTDAVRNPLCEEVTDEQTGEPYLRVQPLHIDVFLQWAEAADHDGNVLSWGPDFGDGGFINAARTRIVQVERIVPTSVLTNSPDRVSPWQAETVVAAPLGTYPFGSTLLHDDIGWLRDYMDRMSSLKRAGDWSAVEPALNELLQLNAGDHAFLEQAGVRRLRELMA